MFLRIHDGLFMVGNGAIGLSNGKDCAVYLVIDKDDAILIDTGSGLESELILNNIIETGCPLSNIKYIFITHAHGDHAGGTYYLKQKLINSKTVASEPEKYLIENGTEYELGLTFAKYKGSYPQDYVYKHTAIDITANNEEVFKVGNLTVTAIITPGHSEGSTCYLIEKSGMKWLFSGDEVFMNGYLSLLNCPGSTMEGYRIGLPRLAGLNIDGLFPAHHMFTLKDGQSHIDIALERLKGSSLPPMV
ncbi:MBL fold metallo-hydrolase [Thermanaerosceptrum fracticalcis]|uniref:MBL fold metallo-hydrolase n=1 Tax=Thermanaerosceptrum fracticalcis TaxID=1712410 RepID=A0A7G6E1S3_THEFR|nr:MBL fold metallo-hydrolase [Thermanaerosceptrum fracticalcis]QNB46027.1 MBL fold metallo-hydrolase [Thermanaerosceptrum fracticalcis]